LIGPGGCGLALHPLKGLEAFRIREAIRQPVPTTAFSVSCPAIQLRRLGLMKRFPALDYGNTQKMRDELDEQFRNLILPKVFPKSFNHLAPLELYQKEKPYKCQLPEACFPGLKMHNLVSQSYHVGIADVTGHEDMFSLAISGFEFATCPISIEEWSDDSVSAQYLPGLAQWLKQCTGCRDVFCYAYNVGFTP
jgi:hypothetical protein